MSPVYLFGRHFQFGSDTNTTHLEMIDRCVKLRGTKPPNLAQLCKYWSMHSQSPSHF